MNKEVVVAFVSEKIKNEFDSLKTGRFEDQQLYDFIDRALSDLKKNPVCGTKIPKTLWPKEYVQQFRVTNLWKYDLPNGWRLIYTIKNTEIEIVNIVLEWFDHKVYEKRFNY